LRKIKYGLTRIEAEAMDKIAEDLEDTTRRHNSKILYWHVKNWKEIVNNDFSQLKMGPRPQLVIRK